jgi:hypothetical protein
MAASSVSGVERPQILIAGPGVAWRASASRRGEGRLNPSRNTGLVDIRLCSHALAIKSSRSGCVAGTLRRDQGVGTARQFAAQPNCLLAQAFGFGMGLTGTAAMPTLRPPGHKAPRHYAQNGRSEGDEKKRCIGFEERDVTRKRVKDDPHIFTIGDSQP